MISNKQKYEAIRKTLEKLNHRLQPIPISNGDHVYDTQEHQALREIFGIIDQMAEDLYLPQANQETTNNVDNERGVIHESV